MEAMTLQLNSGQEKQLLVENLSPYAIRKLLQKIFTVKEWGQREQINMLQKRKLEGCLCRVPNRFYNQVWDILRRTPKGIRFRNLIMPQQPTINNMTHSELQFALYVESMLNQLEKPEYRQLIVELLCIVSTILIRNPELTLKELNLDNLVIEANRMFCKDNQMTRSDNLDAFISSKYSITAGYFARAVVNNILTGGQLETSAVDIDEDDDGNDDKCTVS
uniref:Phosphorylase b kinase regulatory subunit n=1 Tax=Melanaphis sacchari TaxID=742174 RepID=A0A2H8TML0_9HEMI